MSIAGILILVIVVIAIAYVLGVYYRQRNNGASGPAGLRGSKLVERLLPPRTSEDREVQVVIGWLLSQAFEQTGVKVADDKVAYQRIAEAARKAVQTLKTQKSVTISLPFLTADVTGPKHFETHLTREVIQELARY